MTTAKHSVSVAGVVIDADHVLLIQRRDNDRWEPPGGVLELDESIPDGLRREICEETGATVDVQELTGVYKNVPLHVVALVFRCTLLTPPRETSAEAKRIAWHPLNDVSSLMEDAYAIRVLDATRSPSGLPPPVRSHDGKHLLPN